MGMNFSARRIFDSQLKMIPFSNTVSDCLSELMSAFHCDWTVLSAMRANYILSIVVGVFQIR